MTVFWWFHWALTYFLHTNTCVYSYRGTITTGVRCWQQLNHLEHNLFTCFLPPSLSRQTDSQSTSHISHYGINLLLHCNIVMNEINGVFVSVGTQIPQQGLWKRLLSLDVPVFVLHAMKKWMWRVLSGSLVCQVRWLQPLSNMFQHASVWLSELSYDRVWQREYKLTLLTFQHIKAQLDASQLNRLSFSDSKCHCVMTYLTKLKRNWNNWRSCAPALNQVWSQYRKLAVYSI